MFLNYLIFSLIYLTLVEGNRSAAVIKGIFKPKLITTDLEDKRLFSFLRDKTGLEFRLKIVKTPDMFGYAAGTPLNPNIVLSTGLYESLTWDELQWVLLHEAGHTKLWHIAKNAIAHWSYFL